MRERTAHARAYGAIVVALAIVAAGCSGDDAEQVAKTRTAETSETSETTAAPSTTTMVVDATTTTSELAAATTPTVAPKAATATRPRQVAPKQSSGIVNVVAAPTTTVAPESIKRGGSLIWAARTEAIAAFDPALATSSPAAAQFRSIFDTLVEQDAAGNLVPRIAEAFTSTDAVNWNIKLRPGVKFTDGTDYNAQAVVFNWKRIIDPATKSPAATGFNATIANFEATDGLNVKVVLKQANGQFPRAVASGYAWIGSPTAIQAKGAAEFATSPVGAGPFTVRAFKRDDRLELDRNPGFWEAGKPYVDRLVIRQIPDVAQRYNTLRSGDIDCGTFVEDPNLFETAKGAGFVVQTNVELIGGRDLKFQTSKAPFNDVRARRAVAHGIDRDGFNKTVYKGVASIPQTLIGSASPFHDPTIKVLGYDPKKAQELFDEIAKDGKALEFTLTATQTTALFAEFVQAQFQQFRNVKVTVSTIQSSQAGALFVSGNFDAFATQFGGTGDPDTFLYSLLRTGQPTNASKYTNPEMDKALDAGRVSLDLAARKAAYAQVQRIMVDQVPVHLIVGVPAGLIASKTAKNCDIPLVSVLPYPDFNQVWIDR